MDDSSYVILPRSNLSTVSFALGLPIGAVNEPKGGIASLYMEHIQRNTKRMDEKVYAAHLDKYGIQTFDSVGKTTLFVGMSTPPKNLGTALAGFEEMLLEPEFNEGTLAKLVQQQKANLMQMQQIPNSMLFNFTRWKAAFGESNLTKTSIGTIEELDSITVDDLYAFHKSMFEYKPNFAAIGVNISETDFERFKPVLEKFGSKTNTTELYDKKVPIYHIVNDKMREKSMNSYMSVNMLSYGHDIIDESDAIFNNILSGGFSAKMFTEIREKRNLSYGPFSMNTKYNSVGLISAGMDVLPERSDEALKVTLEVMKDILKSKIDEKVLNRAIKSAQKTNVFVSDSSGSYTRWLISKLTSGTEWDLEVVKKRLHDAAESDWQETMLKQFKRENFTLAIAGEPGAAYDKFVEIVEEIVE
ncbi:MAG: insulinase family protein [Candidatus Heimdallarchaeota archaeon]|nr:insulinase family protein [Candidatus Heimdallarchaeota archaeon]